MTAARRHPGAPPGCPRVRCRACGRELAATTAEPYSTIRDDEGRRRRYFYVRRHNRPDDPRRDEDVAWPLGVVRFYPIFYRTEPDGVGRKGGSEGRRVARPGPMRIWPDLSR